jgi:cellulose synthase/poly-beta-1,6-N-acetylglucosamine synthase-like glycosyltransferase
VERPTLISVGESALYGRPLRRGRVRMLALRIAGIGLVATGASYMRWRSQSLSGTGAVGIAFFGAEAFTYAFTVLTVYLLWFARWRQWPTTAPRGRLDIFIPVCGEPVEMVEATLDAALAIAYPHRTYLLNDGRLAGKPNWRQIDELGVRKGVTVFTRTTGPRGKAGNLNCALGRTNGDFVATIDADHCAVPEFAHATLGYFADPAVGFVCTPQQFVVDPMDPLGNRELFFYRQIQASKDAAGVAFSCGNASVYRREALEEIDGFSEWALVEDLHTSFELHAAGWRSAYHAGALTTGTTPQTAAAFLRQRLTWATDGIRIFLYDNPLLKRGLNFVQRLHYLHTTAFYLAALTQVVFLVGPSLYLLGDVSVMHAHSTSEYLANGVPYYLAVAAFVLVAGGRAGGIRAVQSGLAMSPLYLLALLLALLRVRSISGVTAKVALPRFSLLLLPQLIATGGLLLTLLLAVGRSGVTVSVLWAAYLALALSSLVTAVSERRVTTMLLRVLLRGVILSLLVGVLIPDRYAAPWLVHLRVTRAAAAATTQAPVPSGRQVEQRTPTSSIPIRQTLLAPARGLYFGAYNPDLLRSRDAVRLWNKRHGVQLEIAHWYQQWWAGERRFRADWASMISAQGAIPMITWEPWAKRPHQLHATRDRRGRLQLIAAGRYDAYIRSFARAVARYGRPLLLRFAHEMNGGWYPWSVHENGNTPAAYVAAWRHVHDVFEAEGATNVRWVWAVNSFAGLSAGARDVAPYYPGARYVDWVSTTGFNWDSRRVPARSFDEVFADTYRTLKRFGKPIMISEVGSEGGAAAAAAWIRNAIAELPRHYPQVHALVWFDSHYTSAVDFELKGAAATALRTAIDNRRVYFETPLREVVRQPWSAKARASARDASARQSRSLSTLNQTSASSRG